MMGHGNGYDSIYLRNTSTFCIPISCYDNGDTPFSVISLLSNTTLATIAEHTGTIPVEEGIALRGFNIKSGPAHIDRVNLDVFSAV
ncbi:hypothetical protein [Candidatus Regiella insecticola]|uniref:hypothetical protein n=1 Tax=Candidatus Regiella insecticola TaxID=138073 RepID=UPI0012FE8F11